MKIVRLKVKNYKSISSSDLILHKGFNIFSGRNNSGKTALLESIFKGINSEPVMNPIVTPFYRTTLSLTLVLNMEDKRKIDRLDYNNYRDILEQLDKIELTLEFYKNKTRITKIVAYNLHDVALGTLFEQSDFIPTKMSGAESDLERFQRGIFNWLKDNIIFISTQRNASLNRSIKLNTNINSSASNLHTVLFTLRNNSGEIFDKIHSTFLTIFPEVQRIHTAFDIDQENNHTTNVLLEFKDSNVPINLQDCGSGYYQVLLSLCLIYSEEQKIILFDEPNTYLHPYAEKAIYDLAANSDKHQYIFSTHSPILINYPVEKSMFFVKRENGQSTYSKMDDIQDLLKDIGATNSNYAFADRVIFVEGPTEEKVLPIIFEANGLKQLGYNYTIININGTGKEFSGQSGMNYYSKKLEGIFNNISESPIPYKIIIDKDEKDQETLDKINEIYKGKVMVLPKREIENYFLIPEAIVALIKHLLPEKSIKVEDIQKAIDKHLEDTNNSKLYRKGSQNPLVDVKGSNLLDLILGDYEIRYDKVKHGEFITQWLCDNDKSQLKAIYELCEDFLKN
ncbi:ATP-dependent nuclease [Bacillus cereus]|uniref:ATP-dependent nuclease n=1 Tax=Bacillus cereus TaxID=1396 RepID=UPI00027C0FF6|nr:AAA family ATPase [Bacillus cereus]EJV56398.1 hypothetical protein IEM_05280 [Bacillus cereus BAG6O-2]